MPVDDANAHSASIAVDVPADVAYAFLADGMNQSYWALGSLERRDLGDNLYVGTSMFDGKELYVRLRPNAELRLVDYFLGADPEQLVHLVESRVIPGEELGRAAGHLRRHEHALAARGRDRRGVGDDVLPLEDRGLPHQGVHRARRRGSRVAELSSGTARSPSTSRAPSRS